MKSGRGTPPSPEAEKIRAASPLPSVEPFFLAGNRIGCLLVHGFTSTPYEMRYLGDRLHAAGYTVCGVCLAGHARRPEDLITHSWRDWYATVEAGLETLSATCSAVLGIGLSLGSLLILRLAHEQPRSIAALALLSPALRLRNAWPARLAPLGRLLVPWLPASIAYVSKVQSDIVDLAARGVHPGYRRMPLRAVFELIALQQEVRRILPAVMQPTLAIHARHDNTAPLENLAILQRQLPNLWGTVILPRSGHVVAVDVEKQRVAEEVIRFAAQVVKESK